MRKCTADGHDFHHIASQRATAIAADRGDGSKRRYEPAETTTPRAQPPGLSEDSK
jgi:hypothetical protein